MMRPALSTLLLASLLWAAPVHAEARKKPSSPSSVAAANAAATQGPQEASLVGALHQFAFEPGQLYKVEAAPQRITDIALEPGEALLSVSAGDTTRWIVGDAQSGAGKTLQAHVLVKPNAAGLATNLIVMTDRRVYHLELKSAATSAMAAVSWRYPTSLTLGGANSAASKVEDEITTGVPIEALNFRYRLTGDKVPWRPVRAFDDGRRVFIQMPDDMVSSDAPPLFVVGESGSELVNYRVRGQYYVVDRLFERAELRLGDKRQKVVRIQRQKTPTQPGAAPNG